MICELVYGPKESLAQYAIWKQMIYFNLHKHILLTTVIYNLKIRKQKAKELIKIT